MDYSGFTKMIFHSIPYNTDSVPVCFFNTFIDVPALKKEYTGSPFSSEVIFSAVTLSSGKVEYSGAEKAILPISFVSWLYKTFPPFSITISQNPEL